MRELPHRRWVVALILVAIAVTSLAVVWQELALFLWLLAVILMSTALLIEGIHLMSGR